VRLDGQQGDGDTDEKRSYGEIHDGDAQLQMDRRVSMGDFWNKCG
jgi:hypothetical protein